MHRIYWKENLLFRVRWKDIQKFLSNPDDQAIYSKITALEKSCFKGAISPKTRPDVIVPGLFSPSKNFCDNSGTRSLLRARLYLIYLTPWILEVIIRKNAEPGWNNSTISDSGWGRIEHVTKTKKLDGMWFGTRQAPAWIFHKPPQEIIRDKEKLTRAKIPSKSSYD